MGVTAGAALSPNDLEGALICRLLRATVSYHVARRERGGCCVGGRQAASCSDLVCDQNDGRYLNIDCTSVRADREGGEFRSQATFSVLCEGRTRPRRGRRFRFPIELGRASSQSPAKTVEGR